MKDFQVCCAHVLISLQYFQSDTMERDFKLLSGCFGNPDEIKFKGK